MVTTQDLKLPPNTSTSFPSTHAVLPGGFVRHGGALTPYFHTASVDGPGKLLFDVPTKPFLVVHPSFLQVLGEDPKLELLATSEVSKGGDGRQFAHEAGVWIEATKEVWFTSNLHRDPSPHNNLHKIKLDALTTGNRTPITSWDDIKPSPDVVTGNGGTLFGNSFLLCSQGLGLDIPSSLAVIDTKAPYKSTTILNNFHGRPFNAINDVVILPAPSEDPAVPHPTTDRSDLHHLPHTTIWFTDPTYGKAQGYKGPSHLPNQVYCFNPTTGDVRVVADGIGMPNGIAFDYRGEKCYITDTATINGDGTGTNWTIDASLAGSIYVYDVVRPPHGADLSAHGPTLHNKRVFAFTDSGVPDGIKTDTDGNVYAGCGDGVQVWNSSGTLIGRILLPPDEVATTTASLSDPEHKARGCANFNFTPDGEMIILAEDRIYKASLSKSVRGSLLPV